MNMGCSCILLLLVISAALALRSFPGRIINNGEPPKHRPPAPRVVPPLSKWERLYGDAGKMPKHRPPAPPGPPAVKR
jgi:hypothetical protein